MDGNSAALVAYERHVKENEIRYEALIESCREEADQIQDLLNTMQTKIDDAGFDIDAETVLSDI